MTILYNFTLNNLQVNVLHTIYFARVILTYYIVLLETGVVTLNLSTKDNNSH